MSYSVSVRDPRVLERVLSEGKNFRIPEECTENSLLIEGLLQFAPRVWQAYNADEVLKKRIADSVAYLMRPDILMNGEVSLFPEEVNFSSQQQFHSYLIYKGKCIHLRNDPGFLQFDWKLPENEKEKWSSRGAELFRCYAGTISSLTDKEKTMLGCTGNSFALAFPLADMAAFLLYPADLKAYQYSEEEKLWFNDKLKREFESM